jgi:thiosulfate reductase cytochrome b subunit
MATLSRSIRQGLPRIEGNGPWPPVGEAPAPAAPVATEAAGVTEHPRPQVAPLTEATAPAPPDLTSTDVAQTLRSADASGDLAAAPAERGILRPLRRGLPRTPGNDPWPPASEAWVKSAANPASAVVTPAPAQSPAETPTAPTASFASFASTNVPSEPVRGTIPLRRGLSRVAGGDPWPPEGLAPAVQTPSAVQADVEHAASESILAPRVTELIPAAPAPAPLANVQAQTKAAPEAIPTARAQPRAGHVAEKVARPKAEAKLYGTRTLVQWIRLVGLAIGGAIAAAAIIVLAARGVTTLPGVPEFLKMYPGEYHLPDVAEPGFPWWARWTHFLNFFLMTLIIRSGYQVRTQQKPPAFWTPKRGGKKISINLWLHQSLDILWLANGLIFVVLLYISGHWMRIVPTSWEVFPNALSALLQYMTLDWPTENGWVNYNSLQQIMYFLVVFVATPLAVITGARMSELWPKNAKVLNKVYPVEAARAVHFPTMLFFVLFILIHVFLVLSTGALRNLNHMYSGTDVVNWTGFWLFAAAIAVTVAGWFAARPLVVAPIAKLFGQVSSR